MINDIKIHHSKNWNEIVKLASDNYGDSTKFWHEFNRLKGKNKPIPNKLIVPPNIPNFTHKNTIIDPNQQADLMKNAWETIFHPNSGASFINNNT